MARVAALCALLTLAGAKALTPTRLARPASHARTIPSVRFAVAARARPVAIDAGMADALFGVAFFTLFSLSGILFIKSAFYEAQDESSIMEGDPFTAIGQRLPFSQPRMTEEAALQKAEELSTQLRVAIAEREYPTALALKRELANLMIDYRIDYNADELPDELIPPPKRPAFLSDGTD
ncbi:hypothetical protein KFE25_010014 [Diacronema lutheri]|uniref:Uncharacterized protein n=1 Tax=Diacronema lutheri TaxID=2081491 RepID=A0A8J6CB09_DIALT|nr:hypothetical protein KFE25_010014 [Diacronema lutheri]